MNFNFRKIRQYCFTNSMFSIIILVLLIPCTNSVVLIGIFTSYICHGLFGMILILMDVCVSVRVCACIHCVCIYSRIIIVPANVLCWIWYMLCMYSYRAHGIALTDDNSSPIGTLGKNFLYKIALKWIDDNVESLWWDTGDPWRFLWLQ